MKASNEFVVGKHGIGIEWINCLNYNDFKKRFGDTEFEARPMPIFQKLGHSMTDAEIESELKPGICELGDVLAFMDNAPQECKDGYVNLFYTNAFVVGVYWSDDDGWDVDAEERSASTWGVSGRVFSPAN